MPYCKSCDRQIPWVGLCAVCRGAVKDPGTTVSEIVVQKDEMWTPPGLADAEMVKSAKELPAPAEMPLMNVAATLVVVPGQRCPTCGYVKRPRMTDAERQKKYRASKA